MLALKYELERMERNETKRGRAKKPVAKEISKKHHLSQYCVENNSEFGCKVWHITMRADPLNWETQIKEFSLWMDENTKEWLAQLERGQPSEKYPDGYLHFQGKFSLIIKAKMGALNESLAKAGFRKYHLSQCSAYSRDDYSYVCKTNSKVAGPWGCEKYVERPKVIRMVNDDVQDLWETNRWYTWQKEVAASGDTNSQYHNMINIIINCKGGDGKSSLAERIECSGEGKIIPPIFNAEGIAKFVFSQAHGKASKTNPHTGVKVPKMFPLYITDVPRGLTLDDLPPNLKIIRESEFWAGLEGLKNGYIYETRYCGDSLFFKRPCVFVFSNNEPKFGCISDHKFRAWTIKDVTVDGKLDKILVPYVRKPPMVREPRRIFNYQPSFSDCYYDHAKPTIKTSDLEALDAIIKRVQSKTTQAIFSS